MARLACVLCGFFARSIWSVSAAEGAKQWTAHELPNPRLQQSSVCDPDGLLSERDKIDAAVKVLEQDYEYPGCGGYEMAVVVVRRVLGGSGAVEQFARDVMDNWGVGKAECNNGIVLAIASDDRQMYIATGKGAREYLADRELEAVIDRMKPVMRQGDYAGAAEQAVSDVARILSGESLAPSQVLSQLVFGIVVLGLGFTGVKHCWSERKYGRCKRVLSQIERERAEARANRYQVVSCAICLETFADTPNQETKLLQCGHTFHHRCLQGWEAGHTNCPMCRAPTDPAAAAAVGAAATSSSTGQPLLRGVFSGSSLGYESEYQFRVRRARALYPNYVSQNMADRWCTQGYTGPLAADTAFIRASPSYAAPGSRSSGGSTSSSFGGGSSGGGGGAGGGW